MFLCSPLFTSTALFQPSGFPSLLLWLDLFDFFHYLILLCISISFPFSFSLFHLCMSLLFHKIMQACTDKTGFWEPLRKCFLWLFMFLLQPLISQQFYLSSFKHFIEDFLYITGLNGQFGFDAYIQNLHLHWLTKGETICSVDMGLAWLLTRKRLG